MSTLRVLKQGHSGTDVQNWQFFLAGLGFYQGSVDRQFGPITATSTKEFQKSKKLKADGVVGPMTYAEAIKVGFHIVEDLDLDVPPHPDFKPLANNSVRASRWGVFQYRSSPTSGNPERIEILGDWVSKNIKTVTCPALGVRVSLNVRVVDSYLAMMGDIVKEGLKDRLLTHEGGFAPRFVRGSRTSLSNHAWGSAFDVNAAWNGLGATPAYIGKKGCVREIVPIANAHGWYWGGHFSKRKDGMHFEKV